MPKDMKSMPDILDTSKEYEWFLTSIIQKTIRGKPTLIFLWKCTTENITLKEFLRKEGSRGAIPRVRKFMTSLGWDSVKQPDMTEEKFFEKGMHIKAKPLRSYAELNSETLTWRLNYETVRPVKEDYAAALNDEEKRRLIQLAERQSSYTDALVKVTQVHIEWVRPFLQLVEQGEIQFGSKS